MTAPGLLLIRLPLAVVLVAHGAHALFGLFAGPGVGPGGLDATMEYFSGLGLPRLVALAVAHGILQLAGGLLIAAGWFTRPAALTLAMYLFALLLRDAARWGFFLNWTQDPTRGQGMEFVVLMIGVLIGLVFAGAGSWSIDGIRARSAASRAAGLARLRRR